MNIIVTNDRFDKLTNLDISTHYRDIDIYLFPSDFLGALAYWITVQNPNRQLIDMKPALLAYQDYIQGCFENRRMPEKFNFDRLQEVVNENVFGGIPEILLLNEMKPDFIDLGALARNVFYMLLREQITQR